MTHQDAVDRDIVDAYVSGRLTADERAAFEEHYFACDACFAALQAAEGLRAGVRHLAAAGELNAAPGPAIAFRPTARDASMLPWLLATAAVVIAAAGGWWLESQAANLRRDLGTAQQRSTELERALAQARAAAPSPGAQVARAEPEANVPLAILQTTRSAADAVRLAVPAAARHFIVWLEDAPALQGAGELTLLTADGRTVHTVGGLRANGNGAIVASFPADTVAPGVYLLRLTEPGRPRPAGEYRLTIARP